MKFDKMKPVIYDIEVFKNFFCIGLIIDNEYKVFGLTKFKTYYNEELKEKLENENYFLVGYNNKFYDDTVMSMIINRKKITHEELKEYSDKLINNQIQFFNRIKNPVWTYKSLDIVKELFPNGKGDVKSLKEIQLENGWKFDLYEDFDKEVKKEDLKEILDYLKNDVETTKKLYDSYVKEDLNTYVELSNIFELKDDDIINRVLSQSAKIKFDFDITNDIQLKDGVKFNFPKLETFPDTFEFFNKVYMNPSVVEQKAFVFKDNVFTLGAGGIHSANNNTLYESDSNGDVFWIDIGSYYPHTILRLLKDNPHVNLDINLDLEKYEKIIHERMEAKKNGDKKKANSLKLLINSIYGMLKYGVKGNKFFNPNLGLAVCMEGQYRLLRYLDLLELNELKYDLVQTNTDGIVIKTKYTEKLQEIGEIWKKENYDLYDYDLIKVDKSYQVNVNNYVSKIGDYVKTKGSALLNSYNISKKGKSNISFPFAVNKMLVDHYTKSKSKYNIRDFEIIIKSNANIKYDNLPKISIIYLTNESLGQPLTYNGGKHKEVNNEYLYYTTDVKKLDVRIYKKLVDNKINIYANNEHLTWAIDKTESYDKKLELYDLFNSMGMEIVPFKKDKMRFANTVTDKITPKQAMSLKMCEALAIKPKSNYIVFDFDIDTQEEFDDLEPWLKGIYKKESIVSLNPIKEFRRKVLVKSPVPLKPFKISHKNVEIFNGDKTATLWGKYKKVKIKWISYDLQLNDVYELPESFIKPFCKFIFKLTPKKSKSTFNGNVLDHIDTNLINKYKIHLNDRGYYVGYCPNNHNHKSMGKSPTECLYYVNDYDFVGTKCIHSNSKCYEYNKKVLNNG